MSTFKEYLISVYGEIYNTPNMYLSFFKHKHPDVNILHISHVISKGVITTIELEEVSFKTIHTDSDLINTTEGFDYYAVFRRFFDENYKAYTKRLNNIKNPKKYIYMITFTLKSENVNKGDEALEYIKQQAKRKALNIMHYEYVEELTKNNVRHWHLVIQTQKPLKKDRFNYYIAKFGNIDFSSTKAQILDNALNYITKTNDSVCLIKNGQTV